ncbi:MAG: hypothetical protein ACAI38_12835 [Myxococcota bacterium]|nr:hypothetical protein [Myxococcota bacterium]
MNTALTGTALTLHDLGVAAGFGGALFGQMAFHPAMKAVGNTKERGELLHRAWRNFSPAHAAGIAIVGLTWLTGRTMISGSEIDSTTRRLVLAKDVMVASYVASGLGAIGLGFLGGQNEPRVSTAEKAVGNREPNDTALKASGHLGRINIIAGAAIIALTAVLNIKAGRSAKWSALSRFLP